MSSSNVCVLALCFVLFAVTQCRVIKTKEFPIPPEGVTMEIFLKKKADPAHPLGFLKIDIDQLMKKMIITQKDFSRERSIMPKIHKVLSKEPRVTPVTHKLPTLENRFGVRVGSCPTGFVRRGNNCLPDSSDY